MEEGIKEGLKRYSNILKNKKMKKPIVPSVIARSQQEMEKLIEKLQKAKNSYSWIHLDIMDGKFVKNTSLNFDFNLSVSKRLGRGKKYEAHLMISNPKEWITKNWKKADKIIFHIECLKNSKEAGKIIKLIKSKKRKAAVALNPETPIRKIRQFLRVLDSVLIMSVNPGFYGSKFMPETLEKTNRAQHVAIKTCDDLGVPRNIAEIGKERIRRAANNIKEENPDYKGDLGFKVFKLASSNIKAWNPDRTDLEQTLFDHQEHLVSGRTEQDVLYELLLKRGVDLTVPIEERDVNGKMVYSIGYGVLFACLDESLASGDIESVAQAIVSWHKELKPASDTHVFFRDSAFADDVAKTNMAAILEQNGISHVRSL